VGFLIVFALFVLCSTVLLFYCLNFYLRLLRYKTAPLLSIVPSVSVIVVANNEFENLQKLIPALFDQDHPQFEVVLVDDRSYDETYEHYLALSKSNFKLKFLRVDEVIETTTAKKFALTLAIKAAQYEHVVFVDADCLPASNQWLRQMASQLSDQTKIVLGVSPYRFKGGLLNLLIQFETGMTAIHYLSAALAKMPYMAVGRNWSYHKSLFLNNKGFHPHNKVKGGDDDLFLQKVATAENVSICTSPEAFNYSEPKQSWIEWLEQKKRHYSVGKLYTTQAKWLTGVFHASHLVWYILFGVLLFSQEFRVYSSALFLLGFATSWSMVSLLFKKLDAKIEWYLFPFFDVLYSIAVVSVGLWGIKAREIRWK
jgi:poly-beta-1,6-N-acetyl-D-glucosamine synthase